MRTAQWLLLLVVSASLRVQAETPDFFVTGQVVRYSSGRIALKLSNGQLAEFDSSAVVEGKPAIGAKVKIKTNFAMLADSFRQN